jgi:hypothetical protein
MTNLYKFAYTFVMALSFLFIILVASPVHSATIIIGNNDTIYIRGDILEGDGEKFQKILEISPKASIVDIKSYGGIVYEGLIISEEIFNRGMTTYVPKDGVCDSLCPIIFLSGKEKIMHFDQLLGFHPPYTEEDDGKKIIHADTVGHISWWLGRIGIPLEIVWAMMVSSPEDVFSVNGIELNSVGIDIIIMN